MILFSWTVRQPLCILKFIFEPLIVSLSSQRFALAVLTSLFTSYCMLGQAVAALATVPCLDRSNLMVPRTRFRAHRIPANAGLHQQSILFLK